MGSRYIGVVCYYIISIIAFTVLLGIYLFNAPRRLFYDSAIAAFYVIFTTWSVVGIRIAMKEFAQATKTRKRG